MKKSVKNFFVRLLIFIIVTVSAMVLGVVIWNDDSNAVAFSMSASLGSVIIMMTGAMIKNLSEYRKTGAFFGTRNDTAALGTIGYVMSRIAWSLFLIYCILAGFDFDINSNGGIALGLGLAVISGFVSIIIGVVFFSRRSSEKGIDTAGLSVEQFVSRYGDGIGKYSSVNADGFLGTDERSQRLASLLTGGKETGMSEYDNPPLVAAINNGYLFPMPDIFPRSVWQLQAMSAEHFILPLNAVLMRLGYPAAIRPEQWEGALKGFATTQLANRLRDGVNINYYLAHCAERILESEGLAIVELVFGAGGRYCGVIPLQSMPYLQQLCM